MRSMGRSISTGDDTLGLLSIETTWWAALLLQDGSWPSPIMQGCCRPYNRQVGVGG